MEIVYLLAAVLLLWCCFNSVLLICRHFLYICRSKGITGKELTPFMLQRINELTDGKSLDSSILLLNKGKKGTPAYFSSILIVLGGKRRHLIDSVARSIHFSICKQRSIATASCFLRTALTVLIHLCMKNWRPAETAGRPEPTEIPHIWSLTLPAPRWRLRTL